MGLGNELIYILVLPQNDLPCWNQSWNNLEKELEITLSKIVLIKK